MCEVSTSSIQRASKGLLSFCWESLMDSNSFSFPKEHYREVQPAGGAQPNPSHSHCGIILHTYPDGGGGLQLAVIDFADSVTICMIHCDTRVKQKKNKKKTQKIGFPRILPRNSFISTLSLQQKGVGGRSQIPIPQLHQWPKIERIPLSAKRSLYLTLPIWEENFQATKILKA